jgi:hypothetical protein
MLVTDQEYDCVVLLTKLVLVAAFGVWLVSRFL